MELNWTWGGGGEIEIGLRVDLEVRRKFPAHLLVPTTHLLMLMLMVQHLWFT